MADAPTILPSAFLIGETVIDTGIVFPSFRILRVS